MAMAARSASPVSRGPGSSGLADVLELILDKGLVIDAFVRVSVIGIEILTVDARIVLASVDTYLRFAEAVNRLDLMETGNSHSLFDLQKDGAKEKAKGALEGGKEGLSDRFSFGKKKDEQESER